MEKEDEISESDQKYYDAYSGLEIYGTEEDADDVEFDEMDDDLAE